MLELPPMRQMPVLSGAGGTEWFVDAHGCRPDTLRSVDVIAAVFARIIGDLGLVPVSAPLWHVFPGEGGLTGLQLLSESHLACHTFPERGFVALNLYCCVPRAEWPWERELAALLGAQQVFVRSVERGLLPVGLPRHGS
jgi:S-adenosylmethionine decarboxylase